MDSIDRYLTFEEQVKALQAWGITFDGAYTPTKAQRYLRDNNSFYRLSSYCDSFAYTEDARGQRVYRGVDFAHLVDLAVIDFRLREVLLALIIHIEHYLKIHLQTILKAERTDPYEVVRSLRGFVSQSVFEEIRQASRSEYGRDRYAAVAPDPPAWVVIDLMQLGHLRYFIRFLMGRDEARTSVPTDLPSLYYELASLRRVRNAAARNTGLLNGLLQSDEAELSHRIRDALWALTGPDGYVFDEAELQGSALPKALKDVATVLYVHHDLVRSDGVRANAAKQLTSLRARFGQRIAYPADSRVGRTLGFIARLIDQWYPAPATDADPDGEEHER